MSLDLSYPVTVDARQRLVRLGGWGHTPYCWVCQGVIQLFKFLCRERASHCSIEWVGVTWGDEKEFDRIGTAMGKLFDKNIMIFRQEILQLWPHQEKTVFGVSDHVSQKPACSATETTVMIQSFRTNRSGQTVQTQIRLLL